MRIATQKWHTRGTDFIASTANRYCQPLVATRQNSELAHCGHGDLIASRGWHARCLALHRRTLRLWTRTSPCAGRAFELLFRTRRTKLGRARVGASA
jgi:hypothetical protein